MSGPLISLVPGAADPPIDHVSQWTHHANLEMRREKTRQLQLMLESKRVDQKTMEIHMQHNGQNAGNPATPVVRRTCLSSGSFSTPSQTSSPLSLPYGPSPASSLSSNRRRPSNESMASHPYHPNSSIVSLQLDRLVVEPADKPADVPAGGQGYSGDGQASGVGGEWAGMWTMADTPSNDKTSNFPEEHVNVGRYEFTNAMDGHGDMTGRFANATNGFIYNGHSEAPSAYADATGEHVQNGRADVAGGYATNGNARDARVYPMAGYASATTERVHHPRDGYPDANSMHYPHRTMDECADAAPLYMNSSVTARYDNDEATKSWMYENADRTVMYANMMHANALPTSGRFPARSGIYVNGAEGHINTGVV